MTEESDFPTINFSNFYILHRHTKCRSKPQVRSRIETKVWILQLRSRLPPLWCLVGPSSWRVTQSFSAFQHTVNSFKCLKWKRAPLPFFSTWAFVTVNEKCAVDKEFDAAEKHQQPKLFVFNSFYKVSRPDLRPRLLAEGGRSCTVLGLAEAS